LPLPANYSVGVVVAYETSITLARFAEIPSRRAWRRMALHGRLPLCSFYQGSAFLPPVAAIGVVV
jgi:hypothetical protein